MKGCTSDLKVAMGALLLAIVLIWIYMDHEGAFSPAKCLENGGKWDVAKELCIKE